MNDDFKVVIILKDLANNFPIFLEQARIKLLKHTKLIGSHCENELVSDVLFTVIDKLKTSILIDRFYQMTKQDRLRLYVLKAISTNTSFFSAPYLQKKLKEKNQPRIFDNYDYFSQIEEPEEREEEDLQFVKDASITIYIKSMLVLPKSKELFGDDYRYYTELFKEYTSTNSSYQTLASKYNIPKSSIAFHLRQVKDKIREELIRTNNLY